MSQNIVVGSKVKVVSGGRYLGKEGIVKSIHGDATTINGSFPRSSNKTEQTFWTEDLKVLELPPGVISLPTKYESAERAGILYPNDDIELGSIEERTGGALTHIDGSEIKTAKPQGSQHESPSAVAVPDIE